MLRFHPCGQALNKRAFKCNFVLQVRYDEPCGVLHHRSLCAYHNRNFVLVKFKFWGINKGWVLHC